MDAARFHFPAAGSEKPKSLPRPGSAPAQRSATKSSLAVGPNRASQQLPLATVRQEAKKQGKALSYHDAQQEARRLYWQWKIEPDQAPSANHSLKSRLVAVLADILGRPNAERIADAINDMVRAASLEQQAPSIRKAGSPPTSDAVSNASRLLNVKQLAELMGTAERTVWRMSKEDPDFPKAVRLGAKVRWRVTDYNAWVEQQQANGGPPVDETS